jgi:hypothetical protein
MKFINYLEYTLHCVEKTAETFRAIAERHSAEPDVYSNCLKFADWSDNHYTEIKSVYSEIGKSGKQESDRIGTPLINLRTGGIGLIRDLHDVWLMTSEVKLCLIILIQCSKALRNKPFTLILESCCQETERENEWLLSKIKLAASQVLTVPV